MTPPSQVGTESLQSRGRGRPRRRISTQEEHRQSCALGGLRKGQHEVAARKPFPEPSLRQPQGPDDRLAVGNAMTRIRVSAALGACRELTTVSTFGVTIQPPFRSRTPSRKARNQRRLVQPVEWQTHDGGRLVRLGWPG